MKQSEYNALSKAEKQKLLTAQVVKLETTCAIKSNSKVGDTEGGTCRVYRVLFGEVIMSNWHESPKVAMDEAYEVLGDLS